MLRIVSAVELASKGVQCDLDEIQRRLNEFLAAEENAMKERIRYDWTLAADTYIWSRLFTDI